MANLTNITDIINNTLPVAFSPYTDFFQNVFGNGDIFYLVPLIALTFGIWFKTEEPVMASMFMIGSGSILGMGTLFVGAYNIGILFTIFAAIGIASLVVGLILNRRE